MTNEWLNKEPAQEVSWRKRTKNGRIRLLEERVAKLEERVNILEERTSPPLSVSPWNGTPIDSRQLPRICGTNPVISVGTFRDGNWRPYTDCRNGKDNDIAAYGYPETTG